MCEVKAAGSSRRRAGAYGILTEDSDVSTRRYVLAVHVAWSASPGWEQDCVMLRITHGDSTRVPVRRMVLAARFSMIAQALISHSIRPQGGCSTDWNEPNHARPENTAQTALPPNPEFRSGGKRTTLRRTKRKYVQDSYHTIIILDSAIALTPKQLLVGIWLLSRCQPTSQEGLRNISRSKLNATIHEPLI